MRYDKFRYTDYYYASRARHPEMDEAMVEQVAGSPYSYAIDNRRVHWGRLDAGWYGKSIISASASAGILVSVVINAYPDDKLY
jgi:hypothetical protein